MSILTSTGTGIYSKTVDLGLSVRWASCNIGANSPDEEGYYFAFKEPKGHSIYELDNQMFTQEWYNIPYSNSFCKEQDAAQNYFGGTFTMPTLTQCEELLRFTTPSLEYLNDRSGILFTSIKNSNSIFIPFAGHVDRGHIFYARSQFMLYTRSMSSPLGADPYVLFGNYSGSVEVTNKFWEFYGCNIRPVCKNL